MEAFEAMVAIALERERLLVSGPEKFRVRRQVQKKSRAEFQTHGYEVDLIGARSDRLVLASVKSFFGSRGVVAKDVFGNGVDYLGWAGYKLLNDDVIRQGVIDAACERYGYPPEQVELRLYVGKFANPAGQSETQVREAASKITAGGAPIKVIGVQEVVARARGAAASKGYRDNPVLVTIKALVAAGVLDEVPSEPLPDQD